MGLFRKSKEFQDMGNQVKLPSPLATTPTDNVPKAGSQILSDNDFYAGWKDERTAECPNCQGILKKTPGAKTKCPHCGKFMFVRMDPRTKSQRVVTEIEVELIEDERAKIDGNWPERLAEKNRKIEVTNNLRQEWGQEPSSEDVQWELWNHELLSHASARDWGLYRNTLLSMAQSADKRKKPSEALLLFMDVMYLDACGPGNGGMGWTASERMYLPFIAGCIQKICKKVSLNESELVERYSVRAEKLKQNLKLPIAFEVAWPIFKKDNQLFTI